MILKWHATPGEAAAIVTALQPLAIRTRSERGCTGVSLSTDAGTRVEIRYVAAWESEPDVQRYVRSATFSQLAELMERATDRPTLEFIFPAKTCGLEYAEQVRSIDPRNP
jgi:quinol monooxygenase YgiN